MATGGADLLNTVVIGATGATGKCLVGSLLKAKDKVAKVTILTRRKLESVGQEYGVDIGAEETAGRLQQHVEDLNDISDDTVKQLCTGSHVFFNCLGTTRMQAGSADAFRHIDYEIPIRLIKLAHQAGVPHCSLLTSGRSNANSWFVFHRTKGELEMSVKGLEFSYTSIFRPGFLDRGHMARFGEKIAKVFMTPLPVSTLAEGMMQDAWNYLSSGGSSAPADKVAIFGNNDIRRLSEEGKGSTEESEQPKDNQPAQTSGEQQQRPPSKEEGQMEELTEELEQPKEKEPDKPKEEEQQQPKEEEQQQPKEEEPEQPTEEEQQQPKVGEEQPEQPKEEEQPEQSSSEEPKEEQPAQSS